MGNICAYCGGVWPCWRVARAGVKGLKEKVEEALNDLDRLMCNDDKCLICHGEEHERWCGWDTTRKKLAAVLSEEI